MTETVTYSFGELTITAPREWTVLARANAIAELQYGHVLTEWLALLAAMQFGGLQGFAALMLIGGWSPGDP